MKRLLPLLACCICALAQPAQQPSPASEQDEIRRGLAEANSSQVEALRFVEDYLAAHPNTAYHAELERRAALAAIAVHDDRLTALYGEEVLARNPDDTQLLPPVTRALLNSGSRADAERALHYAQHSEELVRRMQKDGNPGNVNPIEWANQGDFALNRSLTDQARAIGSLALPEDALKLAQRAWEVYPDSASAREIASWDERLGKTNDAIRALADAFAIPDPHATDAERAQARAHLGELYRKAKGSEDGLGALCLEAYDRDAALLKARDAAMHRGEPNAGITDPMDFTLSALEGENLRLGSLKGKVVVMDLWATWCIPCREQHPLYEEVKQRFRDNPAVVFLSVNADTERGAVKPFLESMKWQGPIYFEDGLTRAFALEGLPATILLGRDGKLFTHLNGYVDKADFVNVLTSRIRAALAAR